MSRADYAHWNEEADQVWWQEEGRHADREPQESFDPHEQDALDAFCEEVEEWSEATIQDHLNDRDWCREWPKAARCLREILADRS